MVALEDPDRCSSTTGITPTITISTAAKEASLRRSSLAKRYTCVARVLKLNGLRMSVAGSSRMTSTNTNKHAPKMLGFNRGKWIRHVRPSVVAPSVRAAASRSGEILVKPDSSAW